MSHKIPISTTSVLPGPSGEGVIHTGPSSENLSRIPDHVVPPAFFYQLPSQLIEPSERRQSSIVTIFAIWNTMMGTSILSMPWALEKAGFALGIAIMVVMAGICLYTAYRVIQVQQLTDLPGADNDFSDVCRHLLGRWAEWASSIFSISSLLGAIIVYWVLMTNFLYNTGSFVFELQQDNPSTKSSSPFSDVQCLPVNVTNPQNKSRLEEFGVSRHEFEKFWSLNTTVPLLLIIPISGLVNFRSATCFTKCNAVGTLSVFFIAAFVIIKAFRWGINIDVHDRSSSSYIPQFQGTFPVLTGTLTLAYFIHNCVTSIMKLQRHPENNARDLSIAYCLVAATYIFIGVTFYVTFPLDKKCIEDNLLNNFKSADVLTFVARLFLLVQMLCVFPLLMYIVRIQFLYQVFDTRDPSWKYYIPLNYALIAIAVLFAMFYPHIGNLIRYTGSVCGLVYTFTLPCLTYLVAIYKRGNLTKTKIFFHFFITSIGVANFIAQIFY